MYKVLIIDDEKLAREITKKYLTDNNEVEIIGEASNGFDAIKIINEQKPDLIFLDIQMPKLTGFEMLDLIDNPPVIIFTTAYDNYALKAFEANAVDYLLKPFSKERFEEAIQKAFIYLRDKLKQNSIQNLIKHNDETKRYLDRVVIKDGTKINIVPIDKIRWLEAQDDYVMVHSDDGKLLKQKTMKYFENHLDPKYFVRIHRSYIVNIDFINHLELNEKDTYRIILKNNNPLPVSKTGLSKLKDVIK
jgi:two-component system, LytTR family, response regulator